MRLKLPKLDDGACFVGILLGLGAGALYAILHIKQRGAVRRRDLVDFGAGSGELEMQAKLEEAKRRAKARLESAD